MARPDGRLEPGQPLRGAISARAWNRMVDASDIVHGDQFSQSATGPQNGKVPYTWVYCKPSVTVARWGIVAITGVDLSPSDTVDSPVVTGGTPSATTTAWGVAVEPIASGSIGRLAVGGVVQCKVEVASVNDELAACKASGTELKTGASGEAVILWKESGTGGGKWALVRLGGGGAAGIKRGTFSAPWNKGSTKTVTDATSSGTTYSNVKNYYTSITGTGTKDCAIAYVGSEWVLVEFDLLQLDGYSSGKSQVLGTVSGALKWIDTTDCT